VRRDVGAPGAATTTVITVDGVAQASLDISSAPVSVTLGIDTDITTTSTTTVDAAGFLATLQPGTYVLDAYLIDQSSASGVGPRFGLGGTAGATLTNFIVEQTTSANARTVAIGTALNVGYGQNPGTVAVSYLAAVHARFTITTAGTFGLRWAMSGTGTGTLKAGSYLTIVKV
jgi:hypothetical protein